MSNEEYVKREEFEVIYDKVCRVESILRSWQEWAIKRKKEEELKEKETDEENNRRREEHAEIEDNRLKLYTKQVEDQAKYIQLYEEAVEREILNVERMKRDSRNYARIADVLERIASVLEKKP